jgi:hypothetical protein
MNKLQMLLMRKYCPEFNARMPEDEPGIFEASAIVVSGSLGTHLDIVASKRVEGKKNAYITARWLALKAQWKRPSWLFDCGICYRVKAGRVDERTMVNRFLAMKTLLLAFLTALIIWAAIDYALGAEFEMSVGKSTFQVQRDGTWYQQPFQHEIDLTSSAWAIGMTGKLSDSIRWRAGYAYLGTVSSNAQAVTSDAAYAKYGANAGLYSPMYTWIGTGQVREVYATIAPELHRGLWTYSFEAGYAIYYPTWHERIYEGWGIYPADHKTRFEITPIIGFSIGYRKTSMVLSFQSVNAAGDEYPAVYKGVVKTLSMRQKF